LPHLGKIVKGSYLVQNIAAVCLSLVSNQSRSAAQVGDIIELTGLNTAGYNGMKARVKEFREDQRIGVEARR
jgi:hypothetical protein